MINFSIELVEGEWEFLRNNMWQTLEQEGIDLENIDSCLDTLFDDLKYSGIVLKEE